MFGKYLLQVGPVSKSNHLPKITQANLEMETLELPEGSNLKILFTHLVQYNKRPLNNEHKIRPSHV